MENDIKIKDALKLIATLRASPEKKDKEIEQQVINLIDYKFFQEKDGLTKLKELYDNDKYRDFIYQTVMFQCANSDRKNKMSMDVRLCAKYLTPIDPPIDLINTVEEDIIEKSPFILGLHKIPSNNLYMMYIERDNQHLNQFKKYGEYTREQYNKNLFDKKTAGSELDHYDTGYSKAMTAAFKLLAKKLESKEKLSEQLIKDFHVEAVQNVGIAMNYNVPIEGGKYRDFNSGIGFTSSAISEGFFNEIKQNTKVTINSQEIGCYKLGNFGKNSDLDKSSEYTVKNGNETTVIFKNTNDNLDISEALSYLVNNYNKQIDEGKDPLKTIGDFIHNCDNLHPFPDGNGRVFEFLILNYLLLQNNLTPCSLFNAWHLSGLTSDQRIEAIKEGQEFFKKYIMSEKERDVPSAPLTKELEDILPRVENLYNFNNYNNSKIEYKKDDVELNFLDKNKSKIEYEKGDFGLDFLDISLSHSRPCSPKVVSRCPSPDPKLIEVISSERKNSTENSNKK